jgi:hypothetical protein
MNGIMRANGFTDSAEITVLALYDDNLVLISHNTSTMTGNNTKSTPIT